MGHLEKESGVGRVGDAAQDAGRKAEEGGNSPETARTTHEPHYEREDARTAQVEGHSPLVTIHLRDEAAHRAEEKGHPHGDVSTLKRESGTYKSGFFSTIS